MAHFQEVCDNGIRALWLPPNFVEALSAPSSSRFGVSGLGYGAAVLFPGPHCQEPWLRSTWSWDFSGLSLGYLLNCGPAGIYFAPLGAARPQVLRSFMGNPQADRCQLKLPRPAFLQARA